MMSCFQLVEESLTKIKLTLYWSAYHICPTESEVGLVFGKAVVVQDSNVIVICISISKQADTPNMENRFRKPTTKLKDGEKLRNCYTKTNNLSYEN